MKTLCLSISTFLLCACSSIPEKLRLPETTNLVPLSTQQSHEGQMARWGGVIAEVNNNADNTMIEIVSFKLTSSTRPKRSTETQGRFRLYYDGLLDPVIYQKGLSITALGTVQSAEDGKIGEHQYKFPVIKASQLHLWKKVQHIDVNVITNPYLYSSQYRRAPLPYRHSRPIVIHGKNNSQAKPTDQPTKSQQK